MPTINLLDPLWIKHHPRIDVPRHIVAKAIMDNADMARKGLRIGTERSVRSLFRRTLRLWGRKAL